MLFALRTRSRVFLRTLAASILLATAPSDPSGAAPRGPRIEGLTLAMSPAEVMKASSRPCRFHAFLPPIPGVLCVNPGETDVRMAVGFTRSAQPAQVFALLLRFCASGSFDDLGSEIGRRYAVTLVPTPTFPDRSRGARFGPGLVLALYQDGLCRNGQGRFNLLLADRHAYAGEITDGDPAVTEAMPDRP